MFPSDSFYYNLLRIVAQAHYRGIRQVSLQAVLFGSLLTRKLALLTQCSNNAPEVACCHQRTLRNSKTLLYRIVPNTLTPPLHFAKQIYTCFCMHFITLTALLSRLVKWQMIIPKMLQSGLCYFLNGARRQRVLLGELSEHRRCEFSESRTNQSCRTLHLGNTKQAGLAFEA